MWLLLAFLSAALLGFYDVFKKESLRDNAVIPVLFLNTLFSSLLFLPFIVVSARVPGVLEGFREQGGQHYPQYRYPTGEGRWQEAVDWTLPVEKAVAAEELPALLRQKLPKAVKVRVGRFNGKSRCLYL